MYEYTKYSILYKLAHYICVKRLFVKKLLKFVATYIIINTVIGKPITITGQDEEGVKMEEDMNVGEILKETAEENQTRKILDILNQCKDLEEAIAKIRALLEK